MRSSVSLRDLSWAATLIVFVFVLFFGSSYVPGMNEAIEEYVATALFLLAFGIDRLTDRRRRSRPED